ncbi:MAG: isocitrate lyase/phosphoenolpyruvate mutase family protein [Acidimicrobiales bacterium]
MDATERAAHLLRLHRPGEPLLAPNPWDAGSAKLLESLGFSALCTTSSGAAATLGGLDGSMDRDAAVASAGAIAAAVDVPVSADLENGFGDAPEEAAETVRRALAAGLSGGSIEDYSMRPDDPIYPIEQAAERVAAAAEVAHRGPVHFVLTARAENLIRGRVDLADTIRRLQAYQASGADVLYAPGLANLADIEALVNAVDRPVNVIVRADGPTVTELARAGVARISVGGSFTWVALGAVVAAAEELRDEGTLGFLERAKEGGLVARRAFGG